MPMREFPWAPAQGAMAIEIASARADLGPLLAPILCAATMAAVNDERHVLADHGGGCHQALGAAVIEKALRPRGERSGARRGARRRGQLQGSRPSFPRAAAIALWPRPDEDRRPNARALTVAAASGRRMVGVARRSVARAPGRLRRTRSSGRPAVRPGSVWPRAASGSMAARTALATMNIRRSICWPDERSRGSD